MMTRERSRWLACLLFCCGLLLSTAAIAGVLSPKAKQHYDAGIAYFDEPSGAKYEEAYSEFKLAYEESPTYLLLANIGTCALFLERDGEALEAYESYLAQATAKDISAKKRALMASDIQRLKASVVRVTYLANPKAMKLTDKRIPAKGQPIINRYEIKDGALVLGIHPGHHIITATAEGYEPQTWDMDVESASTHTHQFDLKPIAKETEPAPPTKVRVQPQEPRNAAFAPESGNPRSKTVLYIGGAVTGAFLIGATVTGAMLLTKKSEFNDVNRDGLQPERANSLMKDGKFYALLTDMGLGAAVLTAGTTAILYFTSASSHTESRPTSARLKLEPTLGFASAGISMSAKF